jgi:hypothetical protein
MRPPGVLPVLEGFCIGAETTREFLLQIVSDPIGIELNS